jgi:hypothetical protein
MNNQGKFSDIVTQWQHKSRMKQSEEIDFQTNPELLEQLKEENRVLGE